uniref:Uncharacterized protein n=1 Tax=Panagrolaimus superbus TaxID=310955 RepID=A0A914XTL5_9BILA
MSKNFFGSNWSSQDNGDENHDKNEKDKEDEKTSSKYGHWGSSDDEKESKYDSYGYDKSPGYQSSPDRSPPRKIDDNEYYFTQ